MDNKVHRYFIDFYIKVNGKQYLIEVKPDRFTRVSMGNTGLPYNPDISEEVIEEMKAFKESNIKLTLPSMSKQLYQMDSGKTHPRLKFMYWQKFCWDTEDLPVGFMQSMVWDKRSVVSAVLNYFFVLIGKYGASPFKSDIAKIYEAPFPDPSYKMGVRAMPSHVPTIPDQSLEEQRKAREFFFTWDKPFLSVFAGDDPVTNGIEQDVLEMCPNAKSAPHIGGGHFYQWKRPRELSELLTKFIKEN
jgi:haloalkane dehalogenase